MLKTFIGFCKSSNKEKEYCIASPGFSSIMTVDNQEAQAGIIADQFGPKWKENTTFDISGSEKLLDPYLDTYDFIEFPDCSREIFCEIIDKIL